MPRNFNLSGIGLGIYLLGLGISFILQQTGGLNILSFWLRLYPILAILLGLDYILANTGRTAQVIAKPSGLVVTIIIVIIAVGLISGFTSRFIKEDIQKFRYFEGFNQHHFDWRHRTQLIVEQDFKLPQGVNTIKITNAFGDIRIDTASNNTILAKAIIEQHFSHNHDTTLRHAFKFVGEVQGSTLLVTLQRPERLKEMKSRHLTAQISINVPKGLSVTVKNTAGNVEVVGVDGNLNIEMAAGNLEVQNVSRDLIVHNKFGTVNIGTVLGNANIISHSGRIQAGKIYGNSYIENSFGEVILEECYGPVTAKLKTGNMNLKLAKIDGNCDIDIKVGNIELGIPAKAQFTLDSECLMGEINSNFDVAVKRKIASATASGAINGGGPLIKIRGNSGNIRLYKL